MGRPEEDKENIVVTVSYPPLITYSCFYHEIFLHWYQQNISLKKIVIKCFFD